MDFGYHHVSFAGEEDRGTALVERARFLDQNGVSWLSMMDHLWQIGGNGSHDEPFLDCYTALPAVAAVTDAMELSALVTPPHYRTPAYLARVLASLDDLSGGRAVLGVGAGWFEEEYAAYGFDFPDAATRIAQLRETIELCQTLWAETPASYHGDHYAVEDVVLEPSPEDVPVLVGGGGEQLTLRAAAEHADRWNVPGADPATYEHKLDVLREHCERERTDYDAIEKTVTLTTVLRETTTAAHDAYEDLAAHTEAGPTPREAFRGLVGTPAEAAERIECYGELGVGTVSVKMPRNDRETIERLVDDVVANV